MTQASSGDGSPQHLAGLLFESRTGAKLLHVPYKGGAPAINDLLGGQVDMIFAPLPEALPHIRPASCTPWAPWAKSAPRPPNIPTLKEGGVDGVYLSAWIGLLAPAGTPQAVLDRLAKSAKGLLAGEATKAKLLELGMEPAGDEAKPLKQVIAEDIKLHGELVRAAGLVPQ